MSNFSVQSPGGPSASYGSGMGGGGQVPSTGPSLANLSPSDRIVLGDITNMQSDQGNPQKLQGDVQKLMGDELGQLDSQGQDIFVKAATNGVKNPRQLGVIKRQLKRHAKPGQWGPLSSEVGATLILAMSQANAGPGNSAGPGSSGPQSGPMREAPAVSAVVSSSDLAANQQAQSSTPQSQPAQT